MGCKQTVSIKNRIGVLNGFGSDYSPVNRPMKASGNALHDTDVESNTVTC